MTWLCREKRKHRLALVVALSCLMPRVFHTAPHLSVGKLQTTQIDVDIFLYFATTINYKTAEGVNMEVMQLHYTFLLCTTLIMFLSLKVAPEAVFPARAAPSFSTNVVSESWRQHAAVTLGMKLIFYLSHIYLF